MPGKRAEDTSSERAFFVITPHLVWALCEDPYQLALWTVIKMVAGESGECYVATGQLATLAMMSVGKVAQCRQRLLELGLLEGEVRRDPGHGRPVYHLRVPDRWQDNRQWQQAHTSLSARTAFKEAQRAGSTAGEGTSPDGSSPPAASLQSRRGAAPAPGSRTPPDSRGQPRAARAGRPPGDAGQGRLTRAQAGRRPSAGRSPDERGVSPGERAPPGERVSPGEGMPPGEGVSPGERGVPPGERVSPGELEGSPGERDVSPGERGVSPGETKKNQKKNPKEKQELERTWKVCLTELSMITTRACYDRWLRGSELLALDDDPPSATIQVRDGYAVDWCSHRLLPPIQRTLGGVLGQPDVALTFCTAPDPH